MIKKNPKTELNWRRWVGNKEYWITFVKRTQKLFVEPYTNQAE